MWTWGSSSRREGREIPVLVLVNPGTLGRQGLVSTEDCEDVESAAVPLSLLKLKKNILETEMQFTPSPLQSA